MARSPKGAHPPSRWLRRRRGMWPFVLILAMVTVFVSSCSPATRSTQTTREQAALLPDGNGLYEGCPLSYGDVCLQRLRQMAAGGFKLVLNYGQLDGSAAQQLAYAHEAQALGMKVIWSLDATAFWDGSNLRTRFNQLATTCGCSDNAGFIRYIVNLAKGLPSTWGYYVGDEVHATDHARMKAFADRIHQLDPTRPRLFIAGEEVSTNGANLLPFVDTAEVTGADFYPIGTAQPLPAIGTIAHAVQAIAARAHKATAFVIQAFSFAEYPSESGVCTPFPTCARFPTASEMLRMRDLVLANARPRLLLWYSYYDIARSDNPMRHWGDLVAAATAR